MWIIGSILGSICLILLNTLSKLLPVTSNAVMTLTALSIFTTYCFWFAYQTSPKTFLTVWFVQSAFVSAGAFFANHYWVKDDITLIQVIGICSIIIGGWLLVK